MDYDTLISAGLSHEQAMSAIKASQEPSKPIATKLGSFIGSIAKKLEKPVSKLTSEFITGFKDTYSK
tara:strand:- start:649 stop:849 length:201 start_codon:yes stop_codon:yes gene_type:complete